MTAKLLLTGGTGFIGQHLQNALNEHGEPFRIAARREVSGADVVQVGEIDGGTDWSSALRDVEVVIHLAGRAHILKETTDDPLSEFRRVNVDGTIRLAEQMIASGCRRLVFVSTIGVNGNTTPIDQPFTEASPPAPQMLYAHAKWEAEQQLKAFGDRLEIVIVRPPLVYGRGAPGNFARLVSWVQRGIPLPLKAVHNRRSLVAVQNLCSLLITCSNHPLANGETFLVSDGEDLSTTELLTRVAEALGCSARLFPFPAVFFHLPLRLVGREAMYNQLFGSLIVDSSKAQRLLGWNPPFSVEQALRELRENPA